MSGSSHPGIKRMSPLGQAVFWFSIADREHAATAPDSPARTAKWRNLVAAHKQLLLMWENVRCRALDYPVHFPHTMLEEFGDRLKEWSSTVLTWRDSRGLQRISCQHTLRREEMVAETLAYGQIQESLSKNGTCPHKGSMGHRGSIGPRTGRSEQWADSEAEAETRQPYTQNRAKHTRHGSLRSVQESGDNSGRRQVSRLKKPRLNWEKGQACRKLAERQKQISACAQNPEGQTRQPPTYLTNDRTTLARSPFVHLHCSPPKIKSSHPQACRFPR